MNINTKKTSLFALTLAAVLVTGCNPDDPSGGNNDDTPDGTGDFYEDNGWELVFSDEFDGTVLDDSKWAYEVNCWGGGNDEDQCYVEDPDNVFVEDGVLNIKAIRESVSGAELNPDSPEYDPAVTKSRNFSSGRLRSVSPYDYVEGQDSGFDFRHDWKYGRMEIRAKVPSGQGTWAAAWMLPTDYEFGGWAMSGEIDILEAVNIGAQSDADDAQSGDVENRVYGTLHYGRAWPGNEYSGESYTAINPAADFHTYTVEWEEGAMRWFVDNVHYATQTKEGWYTHYQDENGVWQTSGTTDAPFNQNFHIILNLAMGGNWAGKVNEGGIDDSIDEATYFVDYVRVYQCEDDATGVSCGTKGEEGTYALQSGVVEPLLPVSADFTADPMIMMGDSVRGDWMVAKWDGDGNDEYEFVEDDAGNYLDLAFNGNGAMYFYGNEGSLTDFTDYAGGEMSFDIRIVEGNANGLTLGMSGPSLTGEGEAATADIDISSMGDVGVTEWTTVTLNMSDILATKPAFDYSEVGVPFKLVQYGGDLDLHVQIKDLQVTRGAPVVAPTATAVFEDTIHADWTTWYCCDGLNTAATASDSDASYGTVVSFEYGADKPAAAFSARAAHGATGDKLIDASADGATLEFDLKMVSEATVGSLAWSIKFESRAAATNVEVNLNTNVDGHTPVLDTWQHYTFNISDLTGLNAEEIEFFMIFPAWEQGAGANLYIDNVEFVGATEVDAPAEAAGPTIAAATPTEDEANVISIFSDAYTDVAGTDFDPNWGQATDATQVDVAGNNTLKYASLNYQGTQFGTAQDVSAMTNVHVDFWTADATELQLFLISSGPVETAYSLPITQSDWVSVDIPLSSFTGVNLADVIQFKVVGNGTVYFDNLYFH
jgi:beta-glucanase (GH16 family)